MIPFLCYGLYAEGSFDQRNPPCAMDYVRETFSAYNYIPPPPVSPKISPDDPYASRPYIPPLVLFCAGSNLRSHFAVLSFPLHHHASDSRFPLGPEEKISASGPPSGTSSRISSFPSLLFDQVLNKWSPSGVSLVVTVQDTFTDTKTLDSFFLLVGF